MTIFMFVKAYDGNIRIDLFPMVGNIYTNHRNTKTHVSVNTCIFFVPALHIAYRYSHMVQCTIDQVWINSSMTSIDYMCYKVNTLWSKILKKEITIFVFVVLNLFKIIKIKVIFVTFLTIYNWIFSNIAKTKFTKINFFTVYRVFITFMKKVKK